MIGVDSDDVTAPVHHNENPADQESAHDTPIFEHVLQSMRLTQNQEQDQCKDQRPYHTIGQNHITVNGDQKFPIHRQYAKQKIT